MRREHFYRFFCISRNQCTNNFRIPNLRLLMILSRSSRRMHWHLSTDSSQRPFNHGKCCRSNKESKRKRDTIDSLLFAFRFSFSAFRVLIDSVSLWGKTKPLLPLRPINKSQCRIKNKKNKNRKPKTENRNERSFNKQFNIIRFVFTIGAP